MVEEESVYLSRSKSRDNKIELNDLNDVRSVYRLHTEDFKKYIKKKTTQGKTEFNKVNELLTLEKYNHIIKFSDLKKELVNQNISQKTTANGLRNFLNYLVENELLDKSKKTDISFFLPLPKYDNVDIEIPSEDEIFSLLHIFEEGKIFSKPPKSHSKIPIKERYLWFIKIMISSGIRGTELKHIIENFKENGIDDSGKQIIIEENGVFSYHINHNRAKKRSYFLFCPSSLYHSLPGGFLNFSVKDYTYISRLLQRIEDNDLLISKTRKIFIKYQRITNIPDEIADFMTGHTGRGIRMSNYIGKRDECLRHYQKMIPIFEKLFNYEYVLDGKTDENTISPYKIENETQDIENSNDSGQVNIQKNDDDEKKEIINREREFSEFEIEENDSEDIKYWKELFNYDLDEFISEISILMENPNMDDLDPILDIFETKKRDFKFWKFLKIELNNLIDEKTMVGGIDKKYKEIIENLLHKKNVL